MCVSPFSDVFFSGVSGLSEEESVAEYDLRQKLDVFAKETLFDLFLHFTGNALTKMKFS